MYHNPRSNVAFLLLGTDFIIGEFPCKTKNNVLKCLRTYHSYTIIYYDLYSVLF